MLKINHGVLVGEIPNVDEKPKSRKTSSRQNVFDDETEDENNPATTPSKKIKALPAAQPSPATPKQIAAVSPTQAPTPRISCFESNLCLHNITPHWIDNDGTANYTVGMSLVAGFT